MKSSIRTVHVLGLAAGLAFYSSFVGRPAGWQDAVPALQPPAAGSGLQGGRRGAPAPAVSAPKQLLEGTDKDDTVTGGEGDDWIFGQKGNDFLQGGAGGDKIDGGEGDDTIDGGAGADVIDSGAGSDTVRGGEGDDFLDGGDGEDLLDGGDGVDDVDGGDGNDLLRGGVGNDMLAGGDDNDTLDGGVGGDRVSGEDGNDSVSGGAGDDALLGGQGDDSLSGDSGDDRVDGGVGNDVLRGGVGNDTLLGSSGDDSLQGGEGHDMLLGGDGADVLSGGFGHDWILGGPGADSAAGNGGDDLFILRAGDVPAGEIETIHGGAGADALILNGFTKNPELLKPGIATAGAVPSAGERQIVDPTTLGVYRLVNIERVEYTQLVAQLGEATDRTVSLLLVNPASTASTGRVLFFAADGSIVAPVAQGKQPAREDLIFTVPPFGSLRLEAGVRGSVTAQVFADTPLGAMVRGGLGAAGASMLAETPLIDSAVIPVLENRAAGVSTGVLIANSIAQSAIKLTLHAMDGRELDGNLFSGMKELELPAYGHRLLFLRDIFPNLPDFEGTMTIDGGDGDRPQEGGPIGVVALERGASGRITTSPGVSMIPTITRQPLHLPGLTTGGDSLVLINPSTNARAQGTLRFFDDAGRPWAISVNRQAAATTVAYNVDPLGSVTFTTSANGPVQRGTVRVDTAQGALGAVLRVPSADRSVVRLPASDAFSSFIVAVRRDGVSGVTTQLSLSSTGPAITLRLTLRSAAGGTIAGGTADIRLPENGHTTRTIEQLFPSAAAETFEGTLTLIAEGGKVAATVVEVDRGSSPSTTLPVIPLP